MATIVTKRGQVTIPMWVRDRLDIGPGDVVAFEAAPDERIVLVKIQGGRPETRPDGHPGGRPWGFVLSGRWRNGE
jgi:AbrB family looped-hinge helix DNA binding protein